MQEDLDNLSAQQDLPTPESPAQEQLSPSPGPTLRRSGRLQSIASGLEADSESEDELLLTDKNAKANLNIASVLYHAMAAFATPETYLQARHSPEWANLSDAISKELRRRTNTLYGMFHRQSKVRVVRARWMYTRNIDGTIGFPSPYKARGVAKGYPQVEAIDHYELYAAVGHKDTIRVVLSLVNDFDLECDQVDIIAAFLNGNLQKTSCMDPPQGSKLPSNKVLRLRNSLYGLKQSPRCFNKAFDKWLREQDFQSRQSRPLFIHSARLSTKTNGDFIMVSIYVDDQLITCNNRIALNKFEQQLSLNLNAQTRVLLVTFLEQ